MSLASILIERDEDRIHYLNDPARDFEFERGVTFGETSFPVRASVLRFTARNAHTRSVVLTLNHAAFSFHNSLTAAEARLLALALNTAADEAEAA